MAHLPTTLEGLHQSIKGRTAAFLVALSRRKFAAFLRQRAAHQFVDEFRERAMSAVGMSSQRLVDLGIEIDRRALRCAQAF
jgi:hypothetical protein